MIAGESFVGKTSIVNKYTDDIFDENYIPTKGSIFKEKDIVIKGYKKFKLHIWDSSGQMDFRNNAKMFYKDASAIIFIYDITKENTFEEFSNFWIKDIKENTSDKINKY